MNVVYGAKPVEEKLLDRMKSHQADAADNRDSVGGGQGCPEHNLRQQEAGKSESPRKMRPLH